MEKLASRTVLHCCSVKSATPNSVNTEEAALGDSTDESLGGSTEMGAPLTRAWWSWGAPLIWEDPLMLPVKQRSNDVKNLLVSMFMDKERRIG